MATGLSWTEWPERTISSESTFSKVGAPVLDHAVSGYVQGLVVVDRNDRMDMHALSHGNGGQSLDERVARAHVVDAR